MKKPINSFRPKRILVTKRNSLAFIEGLFRFIIFFVSFEKLKKQKLQH